MKISVITPSELDRSAQQRWRELHAGNPLLSSPYFSYEFTLAAGQARDDVRIAVLEEQGRVVGFFPYQKQRWGAGFPVGGGLSDHHGVIAAEHTRWSWDDLLSAGRLAYWQFDHLAAWQHPGVPVTQATSPIMDLSQGYAAYRQRNIDSGSLRITKMERKIRKLTREVGPLRFEANDPDDAVLETVLRLKSEQCRRTGIVDFFSWGWTQTLIRAIRCIDNPNFGGRLSSLYVGDRLIAAHFGMRSERVWHWWFPVYDHNNGRHSPGALLLMHAAEWAAAQGHDHIDLGKGDDSYKDSFADGALPLLEGCVTRPGTATFAWQMAQGATQWLRSSPAVRPLVPLLKQVRSWVR